MNVSMQAADIGPAMEVCVEYVDVCVEYMCENHILKFSNTLVFCPVILKNARHVTV